MYFPDVPDQLGMTVGRRIAYLCGKVLPRLLSIERWKIGRLQSERAMTVERRGHSRERSLVTPGTVGEGKLTP